MPEKRTIKKAQELKREGKAPSTQAGAFVEEEIEHIRHGKHGARSTKQAIAIGLSKARQAGVALPPPEKGETSERTRQSAKRAYARGRKKSTISAPAKKSTKRSRAAIAALKHEGRRAASKKALSRQAKSAARKRSSPAKKK